MNELLDKVKNYLRKTLGIEVKALPWPGGDKLPMLFRDKYLFSTCRILNARYLLMVDLKGAGETPAVIRKHAEKIAEAADCEVIYVSEAMASYNRVRLIEQKVAFVVPDNQMYLPTIGMDLREHIRGLRNKEETLQLSPSAQTVVLQAIYFGIGVGEGISQQELSKLTTYTPMTLSRVFNELGQHDFAEVKDRGRERVLRFREGGRPLWDSAKPYLRSPVKRVACIPTLPGDALHAGLTALAECTMLVAPATPVCAMTLSQWKNHYPERKAEPPPIQTDKSATVEIWNYMPLNFNLGKPGSVDPLSLCLSLEGSDDERIEGACKKVLEKMPW